MDKIEEIKVLCAKYGIRPSKDRGQNFVIEPRAIERMVEAADISPEDFVVEIGPGFGVLTTALAKRAKKVLAVEVDGKLAQALKDSPLFRRTVLELVQGDVLKMSNEELVKTVARDFMSRPGGTQGAALHEAKTLPYKVVSNLPYSITSKVLRKFTEFDPKPTIMVLMVQKEVAERVCARPGEMSILSVAVQYYAKPEIIAYVARDAFWPEPEVESAILRITITPSQSPPYIKGEKIAVDEKRLFQIVRIGFSSRRKQLQNNLTAGLHISRQQAFEALKKVGLPETVRPQELSVPNWIALTEVL